MRRILKYCLALSILFHLALGVIALLVPWTPRPAEDVMVVDLADVPRGTDFLPPKPGIIEGARPTPPPKPDRAVRAEKPPEPRAEEMKGRVPARPVNPELPPEKEFPAPRAQEARERPAPGDAQAPRSPGADGGGRAEEAKPASPSKDAPTAAEGGARKSLRDLTPTLGTMVMARTDGRAVRGQDASRGTAAGTEAKGRDKGGIAEERGGGAHLMPLNAPEIQYISYFASIKRKIELVWQYPYDAQVAGVQGELVIIFIIGRNGQLESLDLVNGSGHKVLDDEAKRAIKAAAPFDPIPSQYNVPNLQIQGHFVYEMHTLRLR